MGASHDFRNRNAYTINCPCQCGPLHERRWLSTVQQFKLPSTWASETRAGRTLWFEDKAFGSGCIILVQEKQWSRLLECRIQGSSGCHTLPRDSRWDDLFLCIRTRRWQRSHIHWRASQRKDIQVKVILGFDIRRAEKTLSLSRLTATQFDTKPEASFRIL